MEWKATWNDPLMSYVAAFLNNGLEQDHRGIKQWEYPMRGFGNFQAVARFCCAFDE